MALGHRQDSHWRRWASKVLLVSLWALGACGREGDPPPVDAGPTLMERDRARDEGSDEEGGETLDESQPQSETMAEGGVSDVVLAGPRAVHDGLVVPRSYLVAFRGESGASLRQFSSFSAEGSYFYQPLAESYLSDPRIVSIQYMTAVNLSHPVDPRGIDPWTKLSPFHLRWGESDLDERPAVLSEVDFASESAAAAVLREWQAAGDIWYAEPNYTNELYNTTDAALENIAKKYQEAEKDEVVFDWHKSIKLAKALEVLAKVPKFFNPVIAVLDSGVDVQHPALKDRIWQNQNAGQTGCGNDEFGCDTTKAPLGELGRPTPFPYLTDGHGKPCPADGDVGTCIHGTHVSGIVAAYQEEGDKIKVAGVCPVCKILPIKIITKGADSKKGQAPDAAILRGLKYLTQFSDPTRNRSFVRVANSSFGKYPRSRSVALLVRILSAAPHEILMVGAAGNDRAMKRSYPAAFTEAVAVASIFPQTRSKSAFSNYGPWVDIAAPGESRKLDDLGIRRGILSTVPGGGAEVSSGTSMAAPVVSGVAGLLLATPEGDALGFDQLRSRLVDTADPSIYDPSVPDNDTYYRVKLKGDARRTPLLGGGVVDAEAVLLNQVGNVEQAELVERVEAFTCGTVASRWIGGASSPGVSSGNLPAPPIRDHRAGILWGLMLLMPVFVIGLSRAIRTWR